MTKTAKRRGDRRQNRAALDERDQRDQHDEAGDEGDGEPLRDAEQIAALPRQREAERHDEGERQQQHAGGQVEEGRADGDLLAGELLQRERIERAEEDDRRRPSSAADC